MRVELSRWLQKILVVGASTLTTVAFAATPQAQQNRFEGAWESKWCDPDNTKRECGRFQLQLTQVRDRICGTHYAVTQGLSRIDEGDYASVKGTFAGDVATLVVTNTRTGALYLATATRTREKLSWSVIGMLTEGESDEPTIMPLKQTLTLKKDAKAKAAVSAIKNEPCRWPDEKKVP